MSRRLVWHCRRGTSRKFYTLSVERDLWGNRAIVRRWGRLDGARAAEAIDWDPDRSFDEVAREVHQRRRWHRYELVEDPNRTLSSSPWRIAGRMLTGGRHRDPCPWGMPAFQHLYVDH